MTFARPEGCLQENERLEVEANLSNIIVLDEHNVFITDAQAAYRFDSTTDELHLIEGSYALGNQGVTIESIISPNGMMAIDGHIYAGAGGFWSETKLVEFSKDSNQINRTLALGKGNLISGLCLLDDGTLVAATYTRGNNVTLPLLYRPRIMGHRKRNRNQDNHLTRLFQHRLVKYFFV